MEINIPEAVAEVAAASDRYEAALTANDGPVLDASFWASPLTIRYGMGENLYGHAAIAAFRGGQTTGTSKQVRKKVITTYGHAYATVNIEFERPGMAGIGRQSQTWVRLEGGWRIVSAHVSIVQTPDVQSIDLCPRGSGDLRAPRPSEGPAGYRDRSGG